MHLLAIHSAWKSRVFRERPGVGEEVGVVALVQFEACDSGGEKFGFMVPDEDLASFGQGEIRDKSVSDRKRSGERLERRVKWRVWVHKGVFPEVDLITHARK